mmetsp:Transcript_32246/g.73133  ORF Transcript_32246/g.73133 Transcript_32246/m.73133 type:complete len:346 (+) Transcript_32246:129-1166(+)
MGFFSSLKKAACDAAKQKIYEELGISQSDAQPQSGQMSREDYEANKPDELRKDVRMLSGCADHQTSADVSSVSKFKLPDPAGSAGGACTSTLLKILYADEENPETQLSFTEVLETMREDLKGNRYSQIPQLSSMNPIDVSDTFDLVPPEATGTKRAVMIGINYVGDSPGELSGCWNDVLNMKRYIMQVHGFDEENIVILMDDGEHTAPTFRNIIDAYKIVISQAEEGDSIFLHYSGHGTKMKDDDGDEEDGYDEALCPRDYASAGLIRDDDLYDILVKELPDGVHMFSLMDCCHSGSIMDLPYVFKGGIDSEMHLDPEINLDAFIQQISGKLKEYIERRLRERWG